jgi:beta-lactam-binding protein with PASTA domain
MLGESVRRRNAPRSRRPDGGAPDRGPGRWRHLYWVLPLAVLLPFLAGYVIAVYLIFPPERASGSGIPVPELVGRTVIDAEAELRVAGLVSLDITELPHPTAAAGVVVAQSPLAGQQLRAGAGVRMAVSRGRPQVMVPDVQGFAADRAEALLRRSGFDVVQVTEEGDIPAGRALRTEPAGGQVRALPAAVTLVVSTGPAVVVPDTIPADTLGLPGGW